MRERERERERQHTRDWSRRTVLQQVLDEVTTCGIKVSWQLQAAKQDLLVNAEWVLLKERRIAIGSVGY